MKVNGHIKTAYRGHLPFTDFESYRFTMHIIEKLKVRMRIVQTRAKSDKTLRYLKDYAHAVNRLTWQRQGIFISVAMLTGSFFSPYKAVVFFLACMTCEYVDLYLARKTLVVESGDKISIRALFFGYVANTAASALTLSFYAVWIGLTEDGIGQFTALFCLFAASLYAALNNHQIAAALATRLTFYGASFIIITTSDIIALQPPLGSMVWLPFFTSVFVMYFLIDCSLGFVRMYRRDLKLLEDLKSENEKAKAALVLKSEFVSIVSHELRTPLTSIKGSLDLVNSGKFGDLPPRVQNLLGLAGKNAQRLTELVNDLLDIQKMEDGKLQFDISQIEVDTFLLEAIDCHQGLADRYNVSLSYAPNEKKSIQIDTDVGRLTQVLGNVLSNAAKFSPAGGEVRISYTVNNTHVRISVSDQGIGIPDAAEDKIFARFVQLDSTNHRQFGGTGLGLNISRDIIEAIGGAISYTSELNVGTTFYIDIPRAGVPIPEINSDSKVRASHTPKMYAIA